MHHSQIPPVAARLDELRRRLRRLLLVRGVSGAVAAGLGLLLIAGLIDWWMHMEDPWLRGLFLVVVIGVMGGILFRRVLQPLRAPWDDVSLALLVERIRPEWRDQLATAAQCETPTPGAAGSLPREAAERVWSRLSTADFSAVADRSSAARAILCLAAVLLLCATWIALAPQPALLALHRQLAPWSAPAWPRSSVLSLLDADLQRWDARERRVPAGESLTFYVSNLRGALPKDIRVERRARGDRNEVVSLTPTALRDASGQTRSLAVGTIVPSEGPLELRVSGGDDRDQGWLKFEAIAPPSIEKFRIRVQSPAYTGLDAVEEERGVGHVEGLVGSQVQVEAQATRRLSRAVLWREGASPRELTLTGDRTLVPIQLGIDSVGRSSWRIELTDETGLSSIRAPQYEIRGRADEPPIVNVQSPAESLSATANAVLPLIVDGQDDLGLSSLSLLTWTAEQESAPRRMPIGSAGFPGQNPHPPRSRHVETDWRLEDLHLAAGSRLQWAVEAVDNRLPDPQPARSRPGTINIVTPEQKQRELLALQEGMARLLERLDARQGESVQQSRDLLTQWTVAGEWRSEDRASVEQLDLQRRRLLADLTDPRTGFATQTRRGLDELRWNRLDDEAIVSRMKRLLDGTAPLVDASLPELATPLERLREIFKQDQGSTLTGRAGGKDVGATLRELDLAETTVATRLRALRDELAEFRRDQGTSLRLEELAAAQHELREATGTIGETTVGREWSALDPQQQADLLRTSGRQRKLAEDLAGLRGFASTQSPSAPAADASRGDQILADPALEALGRSAADHLAANRIGEALRDQQALEEGLTRAADQVSHSHEGSARSLLAAIEAARETIAGLQSRQTDVMRQVESLAGDEEARQTALDAARAGQADVLRETEATAVRLQRQRLDGGSRSLTEAAGRMRNAGNRLQGNQPLEALDEQEAGLRDLARAAAELQQESELARQQRMTEMLAGLAAQLSDLAATQEELHERTIAIDEERRDAGRPTRAVLRQITQLGGEQEAAARSIESLAGEVGPVDLVARVLHRTAGLMQAAANGLAQRETGENTTDPQARAIRSLQTLLAGLEGRERDKSNRGKSDFQAPSTRTPTAEQASRGVQVRLLRELQSDLLDRTVALRKALQSGPDSLLEQQLRDLETEQKELAVAADHLLQPLEETGPERSRAP